MNKTEFDQFADEYESIHAKNIAITGEAPTYFAAYKIADIAEVARAESLPAKTILDFGAGVGGSLPHVRTQFPDASVCCLDVSKKSLDIAAKRFPGQARFIAFDDLPLPLADESIDIAFAACVFHHIPHAAHLGLMREIRRVLRPGGRFFVFEHNPANPLTVHAVNTCDFDRNAVLIRAPDMVAAFESAGFSAIVRRFRIFFPRLLKWMRPLERHLTWCGLGAQYYVTGRK